MAMSLRDQIADAEEAMANVFSNMKRNTQSKRSGVDNVIDICYFCDSNCEAALNGDGSDHTAMNAYFASITEELSANLASLDPILSANYYYTAYPGFGIELAWFGSDMEQVNNAFWSTDNLFASAHEFGCDTAFAVVAQSDALMSASGTTGVANLYSICGDNSFGIVAAGDSIAPLLSHEVGHLLGMYHTDAAVDLDNFASVRDLYPTEYNALLANCPDESCGNTCIMNPVVSNIADTYGECGRAYYELMKAISNDYPNVYPASTCIDATHHQRKRQSDAVAPINFNSLIPVGAEEPVFPGGVAE